MNKYAGKKAVVTGGTHGIGLAIVKALIEGGAEVLLTGRNERNLEWRSRADRRPTLKEICQMKNDVSVIGLGAMGSTLARELLRNGYRVTGWNRTSAN